jgi:glycosyltransferase involved in cell wall biosynthesis
MKIATNVHRDVFGGITVSNLALFDWLEEKKDTIVGIEYVTARQFMGPAIFRHYEPSFFRHHIINAIDMFPKYSWEKPIGNIRKKWDVLVEATKNSLRKEAPDIVLVNGTYFAPWILAKAAEELGIPVVLRYAGVLEREAAHKSFFIRRRLLAHEKWIASMANAVIFPSALCKKVVEEEVTKGPLNDEVVIPNPVGMAGELDRKQGGRYTIVAIGRWSPIKNFQAFVELHKTLRKERWPHRAIMVTSYHDKKFGIPETIERLDPMSQEDLKKFYQKIDLLVVPSLFETFCNVAAEAVVYGVSVLVSEDVGFSEILRKAGLGRMVIPSFDDSRLVAKAIRRIKKEPLTVSERKKVASLLDPGRVHAKMLRVLQRVLSAGQVS